MSAAFIILNLVGVLLCYRAGLCVGKASPTLRLQNVALS